MCLMWPDIHQVGKCYRSKKWHLLWQEIIVLVFQGSSRVKCVRNSIFTTLWTSSSKPVLLPFSSQVYTSIWFEKAVVKIKVFSSKPNVLHIFRLKLVFKLLPIFAWKRYKRIALGRGGGKQVGCHSGFKIHCSLSSRFIAFRVHY